MFWKRKPKAPHPSDLDIPQNQGDSWLGRIMSFELVPVVRELWDGYDSWKMTRHWGSAAWIIPALVLLLFAGGALLYNKAFGKNRLVGWYFTLANAEIKLTKSRDEKSGDEPKSAPKSRSASDETGSDVEGTDTKLSPFTQMLYQRILQLEPENSRAKYYVWAQFGAGGNVSKARSKMMEMATNNKPGFLPAHAWLATDLYSQSLAGIPINHETLMHHLKYASEWPFVSPALLTIYGDKLLERGNQRDRDVAISLAQKAASKDPTYSLVLAKLLLGSGQEASGLGAIERAIRELTEKLKESGPKNEKSEDRIQMAKAHLMANRSDDAIRVIQEGIRNNRDRPELHRFHSNLWLQKYATTIKQSESGVSAVLEFLDNAIGSDPLNPLAELELRRLIQFGATADNRYLETLQTQLAQGRAPVVCHTLLANVYRQRNDIQNAVSHWKLALTKIPSLTVALNDLALTLALKLDPPETGQALQMIDQALNLKGPMPELIDTKAQVLIAAGQTSDAIPLLLQVLEREPKSISTRVILAMAYDKIGNSDLANAQRSLADELRTIYQKQNEAEKQPSGNGETIPNPTSE